MLSASQRSPQYTTPVLSGLYRNEVFLFLWLCYQPGRQELGKSDRYGCIHKIPPDAYVLHCIHENTISQDNPRFIVCLLLGTALAEYNMTIVLCKSSGGAVA